MNPTGKRPTTAWLFDIDGVLTDPDLKVIKRPDVLREIAKRLKSGDPIGGNTGRSLRFVEDRLLDPLEGVLRDRSLLRNVYVVGEKGGAWIVHAANGERRRYLDRFLAGLKLGALADDVRHLVREEYADIAFLDETKQTMVTVEMRDGTKVGDFRAVRDRLVVELREVLRERRMDRDFRVDATAIAVDVEHIRAGKAMGAQRFVTFLRQRGINPGHYVTFGDSPSDYDMAAAIDQLGLPVQLVYVGDPDSIRDRDRGSFPVVYTHDRGDDGTFEYLAKAN